MCHPAALYAARISHWPEVGNELDIIKVSCLIVIGEQEGIMADMQQAATEISDCQLDIIPRLDHAYAYWTGDKVSPFIIDFIYSKFPV